MEAGNFYASTGVSLESFGQSGDQYVVNVEPEEGISYEIYFISWKIGADQPTISPAMVGLSASYTLSDKDWFVRAKIVSDKAKDNPYKTGDTEVAWTQPVKMQY